MSSRNNANTIQGLEKRIGEIAARPILEEAQYAHAYLYGWIGALYWADILDVSVRDTLRTKADDALAAWGPSNSGPEKPAG